MTINQTNAGLFVIGVGVIEIIVALLINPASPTKERRKTGKYKRTRVLTSGIVTIFLGLLLYFVLNR